MKDYDTICVYCNSNNLKLFSSMKSLFNLSTRKRDNNCLSREGFKKQVYDTAKAFIERNGLAPDEIRVILYCTDSQFEDAVKRAFYGGCDALNDISKISFEEHLPTIDAVLKVCHTATSDKGEEKVIVECRNFLIPNIIQNDGATHINVKYESIEPIFDRELLHYIAKEFNPNTNSMVVRWQFNSKGANAATDVTFQVTISNKGVRFLENHASEYIFHGKEDRFMICGSKVDIPGSTDNILHIDSLDFDGDLLEVRYNPDKMIWEYKVCSANTVIDGEEYLPSDNLKPMDGSMKITVEGIGLYLEPVGKPRIRK